MVAQARLLGLHVIQLGLSFSGNGRMVHLDMRFPKSKKETSSRREKNDQGSFMLTSGVETYQFARVWMEVYQSNVWKVHVVLGNMNLQFCKSESWKMKTCKFLNSSLGTKCYVL